jgi:hypothetical protein
MVLQRQPPDTLGKGRDLGLASWEDGAGVVDVALDDVAVDVKAGSDGAVAVGIDAGAVSDGVACGDATSPVVVNIVEYLVGKYLRRLGWLESSAMLCRSSSCV